MQGKTTNQIMDKEHTPPKEFPQSGESQSTQDEQMRNIVNNEDVDLELRRMALSALWDSAGIRARRQQSKWDKWTSSWQSYYK
jgi:hypothetical protein